jgi:exopolysaccharide biosynthesis WecB/TagA/CpsF family protein
MFKIICGKGKDKLDLNKGIVTFLNPFSYLLLRNKKSLLDEFDAIFIDGEWLCKFLKWFKIISLKRCSFDNSSLAPIVFNSINSKGLKISIVGSDEWAINKFILYLKNEYPNINVVHYRNGYFANNIELVETINNINQSGADILVVGMGAIKQEEFLVSVKKSGWDGLGFSCGGFIHQTANKGHYYYPKWVNDLNIRFLYRIFDEPKLLRRYVFEYGMFVIFFIYDLINKKIK